jgi:hypothetical protein
VGDDGAAVTSVKNLLKKTASKLRRLRPLRDQRGLSRRSLGAACASSTSTPPRSTCTAARWPGPPDRRRAARILVTLLHAMRQRRGKTRTGQPVPGRRQRGVAGRGGPLGHGRTDPNPMKVAVSSARAPWATASPRPSPPAAPRRAADRRGSRSSWSGPQTSRALGWSASSRRAPRRRPTRGEGLRTARPSTWDVPAAGRPGVEAGRREPGDPGQQHVVDLDHRRSPRDEAPDRVIGMHFMNPVPLMKLVEVIRGSTPATTCDRDRRGSTKALGKIPVLANDYPASSPTAS